MSVGSGAALLGVADGAGGALVTMVGVGTGGSVSGGNSESDIVGWPVAAGLPAGRAAAVLDADGAAEVTRDGRDR